MRIERGQAKMGPNDFLYKMQCNMFLMLKKIKYDDTCIDVITIKCKNY
jgi:hypothetical protein